MYRFTSSSYHCESFWHYILHCWHLTILKQSFLLPRWAVDWTKYNSHLGNHVLIEWDWGKTQTKSKAKLRDSEKAVKSEVKSCAVGCRLKHLRLVTFAKEVPLRDWEKWKYGGAMWWRLLAITSGKERARFCVGTEPEQGVVARRNGERVFVPMSSRSQKAHFSKRKEMPWYEVAVSLSDRWGRVSAHILDFLHGVSSWWKCQQVNRLSG